MQQGLTVSYEGPGISKQPVPANVVFRSVPNLLLLGTVADAHVRPGSYNNVNEGTSAVINTGNNGDNFETYLRFDISSVRSGLSSARLRLYGVLGSTNSPVTVSVYNVGSVSWLEKTITNANKPAAETRVLASTTIAAGPGQYYEWDLTQHINTLRNAGYLYVSLLVKNTSNTNNSLVNFNSKENSVAPPELKVEYTALITQAKGTNTGKDIVKTVNGIAEKGEGSFTIYPNPVSNNFTVTYSPEFMKKELQIVDINGKLLKKVLLTGAGTQNIRVDGLKEGVYFIHIRNNYKRYSQKMVISN